MEATKFTEVGFHGRDVDQIVRDLVDAAIVQTRARLRRRNRAAVARAVEDRILDAFLRESKDNTRVRAAARSAACALPALKAALLVLQVVGLRLLRKCRSRSGTCTGGGCWTRGR